jgi:hypothetical protein
MAWENVGVAPPLVDAKLAVRLSGPSVAVIPTSVSIKGMLPGAQAVGETVALPGTLAAGSYDMAVGVVDTKGKAVVRLAIAGRDADGFYPLGKLTVAP